MPEHLSPRLKLLLGQGLPGEEFWDICCDHGLLGAAALKSGHFKHIHFVDRVPHIIEKLRRGLVGETEASIHLAGAENLRSELSGTVVIAGVGGHNIVNILESWNEQGILRAGRLVLNPLTHIEPLREFLSNFDSYSEKETLSVRESGRDRQILILESRA